jgi:hypothetical protein
MFKNNNWRIKMLELKMSFDKCKNARAQFEWLVKNKKGDFTVVLDNDCTWIDFGEDMDGDNITSEFKRYLGQSEGTLLFLCALGIGAEYC